MTDPDPEPPPADEPGDAEMLRCPACEHEAHGPAACMDAGCDCAWEATPEEIPV